MRIPSPFLAALAGGLASGALVAVILLATGADGDDETAAPAARDTAPVRQAAPLTELYERARRGVVVVEGRQPGVSWPEGPPREDDGVATGSGFAIGDGRIVTNHHVVAGAREIAVRRRGGARARGGGARPRRPGRPPRRRCDRLGRGQGGPRPGRRRDGNRRPPPGHARRNRVPPCRKQAVGRGAARGPTAAGAPTAPTGRAPLRPPGSPPRAPNGGA